jgi:MFS family permease
MNSLPPRRTYILTLSGYYGFALIGWNAVLLASLIRSIERDFQVSDAAFGLLYFLAALCYTAGAFGGGLIAERLGRRGVLLAAALSFGLGLGGEGLAPSWVALILAGVLVNAGAGAIDGGVNGLFLDLYRDARGGALNLLHLFFSVGALIAPLAVGLTLAARVPWRAILLATGAGCLPLVALLATVAMPAGRREEGAGRGSRETGRAPMGAEASLLPFAGLALAIGLYVATETGVSNWLVRLLSGTSVATATGALSLFWGGLAAGRLLSNWLAERMDYTAFTIGCIALSSLTLVAAALSPALPLAVALFALTGLFCGPIYPMIMALGGDLYPRRLAALSGALSGAAVVGSVVYPPLMGVMASRIGLRGGMLGAAALGIPAALGIVFARAAARRARAGSPGAREDESWVPM